jgi:hypothetical protein
MEEDFGVALELVFFRKEVCGVLDSFLSFLKKFDERKSHNMLVLMLDLRFKSLCLAFSFIGCDQRVAIVEEYDTMSLYPMFMKFYYHLHPSIEFDNGVADSRVDNDNNLDIFQMITRNTKTTKELGKRDLLIFLSYLVDVKEIKCPLQW